MSLVPGARLGVYEAIAAIGEGGPPSLVVSFTSSGEVSPKPSTTTR